MGQQHTFSNTKWSKPGFYHFHGLENHKKAGDAFPKM